MASQMGAGTLTCNLSAQRRAQVGGFHIRPLVLWLPAYYVTHGHFYHETILHNSKPPPPKTLGSLVSKTSGRCQLVERADVPRLLPLFQYVYGGGVERCALQYYILIAVSYRGIFLIKCNSERCRNARREDQKHSTLSEHRGRKMWNFSDL